MTRLGLERDIVDRAVYDRTVARFRDTGVALPTLRELADPLSIPASAQQALAGIDPDTPHALNLFRVHWHMGCDRRSTVEVPQHVVLPSTLTGVEAPIALDAAGLVPVVRRSRQGGWLIFLLNLERSPVRTALSPRWKSRRVHDLIGGREVAVKGEGSFEIEVEPWKVGVFYCQE